MTAQIHSNMFSKWTGEQYENAVSAKLGYTLTNGGGSVR